MAGFFGLFNYSKPGKGVDADAPKKHPFFLFWELIWRKLSRLIVLNMMYFVCILPILSFAYTQFYVSIMQYFSDYLPAEEFSLGPLPSLLASFAVSIPYPLFIVLLVVSIVIYGPATCGFTYMMRNFAREEHAWLSDFFSKFKSNFKQGVAIGILELLVYTVFILNLTMDAPVDSATGAVSMVFTVAKYVSLFLAVIFTFMRHYFYTMIVTFELTIWQIIKNAAIFAVLGVFRNLLVSAVIIVTAAALVFFSGWVELILIPLIMFSFWGFLTTFTCYPVIKKYMIDPLNADDGAGETPELEAGNEPDIGEQ